MAVCIDAHVFYVTLEFSGHELCTEPNGLAHRHSSERLDYDAAVVGRKRKVHSRFLGFGRQGKKHFVRTNHPQRLHEVKKDEVG